MRKLRAERENPASLERQFVEVELPSPPSAPLVRVQLGRVTVDFETLPPPAWIAELAHYGGSAANEWDYWQLMTTEPTRA